MKHQKGFTLIELIIVIVILGILAVTAAPRFIDIQKDARTETMQGVKAAIQGASQLVYAKSAIKGVQKSASDSVTISTSTVAVKYGYPDVAAFTAITDFDAFVDIDGGKLVIENTAGDEFIRIRFSGVTTTSAGGCYVQYTNAVSSGAVPDITVNDDLC